MHFPPFTKDKQKIHISYVFANKNIIPKTSIGHSNTHTLHTERCKSNNFQQSQKKLIVHHSKKPNNTKKTSKDTSSQKHHIDKKKTSH